jgi:hypothetical protein
MGRFEDRVSRGVDALDRFDTTTACHWFARAQRQRSLPKIKRAVAGILYNASLTYRWENRKKIIGNAHTKDWDVPHNYRQGWADHEIAAVFYTEKRYNVMNILAGYLGRTYHALEFIYEYAFRSKPVHTWLSESGDRYTRYTQAKAVQSKLGL